MEKRYMLVILILLVFFISSCEDVRFSKKISAEESSINKKNVFPNKIDNLILQGEKNYEVQLDVPSYLDESLSFPRKFFSERPIRIVKKTTIESIFPQTVKLSKRDKESKNLISEKTLDVKKYRKDYFTITIPKETETGYYTIDFQDNNKNFILPIKIAGLTTIEKSQIGSLPSMISFQNNISLLHLNCFNCYWESVSDTNPDNENYSYLVGGGASDHLVQTNDGWETSQLLSIDKLTLNPSKSFYRGDPKIAFDNQGRFTLVSLLIKDWDNLFPIYGGIYQDSSPNNFPPQLNQTVLSTIPENLSNETWLIFDYPKISIDTYPNSSYFDNMYVFANAVWFENIGYTQGFFTITPEGNISERIRTQSGNAVTSTVVGPNGILYASYPADKPWSNSIIKSIDGGLNFIEYNITQTPLSPEVGCTARVSSVSDRAWFIYRGPEIAANENGTIYATWSLPRECITDQNFEYEQYGYDYDIYFSSSEDQGVSWNNPIRINDDETDRDQGFPFIKVDKNGAIYIAFLDRREHEENPFFDVYFSQSIDGGLSFSKNIRVNDYGVPNFWGHRQPGDYLDMVSSGESKIFISHPCYNTTWIDATTPNDACVTKIQKPFSFEPQKYCIDNDGGYNIHKKGLIYFNGRYFGEDFCNFNDPLPEKNTKVRELTCNLNDPTKVVITWVDCPAGCNNGACNRIDKEEGKRFKEL